MVNQHWLKGCHLVPVTPKHSFCYQILSVGENDLKPQIPSELIALGHLHISLSGKQSRHIFLNLMENIYYLGKTVSSDLCWGNSHNSKETFLK